MKLTPGTKLVSLVKEGCCKKSLCAIVASLWFPSVDKPNERKFWLRIVSAPGQSGKVLAYNNFAGIRKFWNW